MAKKLQVLRNLTLFENRTAAINGLKTQLRGLNDGELCLARYKEYTEEGNTSVYNVVTVMGVAAEGATTGKTGATIFDSNSVPADVQDALTALQNEIDATQTGAGLNEAGAYVADTTEGSLINTATSLADADVKLAVALKKEIADRETAIANLDKEDSAVTGQVVKAVSETDGVIEVSRNYLADTDVQIVAANESELATLGTEVKEAYKLVNGNSEKLGSYIKIYKDQTLKEIKLVDSWYEKDGKTVTAETEGATEKIGQGLQYAYYLSNGETEIVTVDVSAFLVQSEFKNGLEVNTNGEVSVKVDTTSGKVQIKAADGENDGTAAVLSVGEDGVKVSNIQAAIDYAVTSKNADAEGDDYVSASAANNKVTIASNVVKMADVDADTKALADVKDVKDYVDAAAAKATTVVSGEDAESGPAVKVSVKTPAAADGHVEYQIAGQDLASATTLATVNGSDTTEGSFRKAVKDAKTAIEGTLADDDAKTLEAINDELDNLGDAMLTEVEKGNGIAVTTKADKKQSISVVLEGARGEGDNSVANALELGTNGLYLSEIWDCGTYE